MSNSKTIIQKALKELKIERELKQYFKYIDSVFGDDYASLLLSLDPSLKNSLQIRTDKFGYTNDEDIIISLLKSSILSKDKNSYINILVKNYIENGDLEDIMELVKSNYSIRKMLTRNFVTESYGSNWEHYSKIDDDDNTLGNLLTLNYFHSSIHSNNNKSKTYKKTY